MLESLQFGDIQKSSHCLVVEDLTIWRKHLSELEAKNLLVTPTCRAVDSNLLGRYSTVKPRGLKDNGRAATSNDLIHLAAVKRNKVALQTFDVSAGNDGDAPAQSFAGLVQYLERALR